MADIRLSRQPDQGRVEADGHRVGGGEHGLRQPLGSAPALAGRVEVPGAVHAHVGVEDEAGREAQEQVLAHRLDGGDRAPGQAGEVAGPGFDHRLAEQPAAKG